MIRKRLDPDAILLFRVEGAVEAARVFVAYDDAETVVSALNITSLLAERSLGPPWHDEPAPVFRARYKEHCDLPLAFDSERVWLSGHSSGIAWASVGDHGGVPRYTMDEFTRWAANTPPVVSRALRREPQPTELQRELELSMRALAVAMQATSVGQFVAAAVSSLETLLGDKKEWGHRIKRLKVLVESRYHSRVDEVIAARHEFVHAARQPGPALSFLGQVALAIAVQAWTKMALLRPSVETRKHLWDLLQPGGRSSAPVLPAGPDTRLVWVHKYLEPSHPNEYHMRFVINGRANCPGSQCGHLLGEEDIFEHSPTEWTFRCRRCGTVSKAKVREPTI